MSKCPFCQHELRIVAVEDVDAGPDRPGQAAPDPVGELRAVLNRIVDEEIEDPKAAGFDDAHVVRVTFEAGTGDAPDDYYVLYIDKESARLLATRYVVSYEPFFRGKEARHTPEKLLVFEEEEEVGGLKLARRQRFYAFGEGSRGDEVTVATVSEIEFPASFDPSRLTRPQGATIDPGPSVIE